jgi:hypothetical protein
MSVTTPGVLDVHLARDARSLLSSLAVDEIDESDHCLLARARTTMLAEFQHRLAARIRTPRVGSRTRSAGAACVPQ